MQQAKETLEIVRPHEALKAELFEEYVKHGDKDGAIHAKMMLVDSMWRHFIIAVDNAKE